MHTVIIDGKASAGIIIDKARLFVKNNPISQYLGIIAVQPSKSSMLYMTNKARTAELVGIDARIIECESRQHAIDTIDQLNRDECGGMILQMPVPFDDVWDVIERIDPKKDLDGFCSANIAALHHNKRSFVPCTALGCLLLLQRYCINLDGACVVIVNRSNIVGRPLASLLLNHNATVTIAHSRTSNLREIMLSADIVVTAVGKPKMFNRSFFKKGCAVLDVGISYGDSGLCGDVDMDDVLGHVGFITPVPGGVGPMTVACLMANFLQIS